MTISGPGALPQGYTVRTPVEDDIPAILALIEAYGQAFNLAGMFRFTPDDIHGDWQRRDLARDAWVALAPDGALVGYEMVEDEGSGVIGMDGYAHPAHRGRGLGSALVALAEKRADELVTQAPEGARVILHVGVIPEDAAACQLLEDRGYELIRTHWLMRIEMAEAPPAAVWPEGISLRTFEPGRDERVVFDAVEEAFTDHWGHVPHPYEEWIARFQRPDFDSSLTFLAFVAPGALGGSAELAGVALCRQQEDQGWVNTLAVRRPWRRQGLGMALLRHAFGVFYQRGERAVGLGVDAQNLTGATRLYQAAGMRPAMTISTYYRELRPGVDLSVQSLQA